MRIGSKDTINRRPYNLGEGSGKTKDICFPLLSSSINKLTGFLAELLRTEPGICREKNRSSNPTSVFSPLLSHHTYLSVSLDIGGFNLLYFFNAFQAKMVHQFFFGQVFPAHIPMEKLAVFYNWQCRGGHHLFYKIRMIAEKVD